MISVVLQMHTENYEQTHSGTKLEETKPWGYEVQKMKTRPLASLNHGGCIIDS